MMHNRHFFGKTQLPNKYIGWVLSSNFRTEANKKATKLSSHIWKLKEEEKNYNITWKFVSQAKPFSPWSVPALHKRETVVQLNQRAKDEH